MPKPIYNNILLFQYDIFNLNLSFFDQAKIAVNQMTGGSQNSQPY
jgi:methenyltetrahydromethanopterin cyclohydrolase